MEWNQKRDLVDAARPLGVSVTVRDVEAGAPRRARATHTLVAYAADKPGIVAGLTRLLADRSVNVTDLSCRLTQEEPPSSYFRVAGGGWWRFGRRGTS